MLEKAKIDRINTLAKKKRENGLTSEEQAEQHLLRQEYLAVLRKEVGGMVEQIHIQGKDGKVTPLRKKNDL